MTVDRHLIIQELSLRPSGEWKPDGRGWTIVRISEGAGYCLQGSAARELNPGDTVITGPATNAVFRASQLGILKLEYFVVLPQYLNGLLTVTEWHQLEDASTRNVPRVLCFAASEPTAQKFARLAALPQREGLATRSALLHLWASSIAGFLSPPNTSPTSGHLRERFLEFISKMPETELATRSLTDLAEQLHCSERHFSRLFRAEFHISLRSRQTELRLQRARQLLTDSNAKIINVAFDSGYRHLGLFNAMFKKRFGVTPSAWRQQNAAPPGNFPGRGGGIAILLLMMAQVFFSTDIMAQTTNATVKTTAATTNVVQRFKVEKYLISGNTILGPEKLGGIFTNVPEAFGTNVSIADVLAARAELEMAYRERGYVTVSVGVPRQAITNATVKINVIEGRLSDIKVQGNNWFSTENVLNSLPSLQTNMLLNSHVFQRELDMANASRDRQIYPVIGPGLEPGTSELTLTVKDRFPAHARVEFNNLATPGTPDNRVTFNTQYDNLWQLEHQAGVQYTFTPLDYATLNNYYFSPIDLPLIANYSAYYRLPLGRPVSVQEQIDTSNGRFGYNEITHQFQMPPATGRPELTLYSSRSVSDSGVIHSGFTNVISTPLVTINSDNTGHNVTLNEGIGAKISWPLPPIGRLNTTLTLGADFKHYEQVSYNSNNFYETELITNGNGSVSAINSTVSSGQPALQTAVEYFPVNLGFSGFMPDAWGTTAFNAQANFNLAAFNGLGRTGTTITHGGLSNVSPGVQDNYITVQMGADRLQTIYKDWTVKIHADGQWANQSLFSNEQYAMGGAGGVRGYPDGQGYGDTGWRMSIEPQTPLMNIGMVDGDVPFWLRASVFMDYGQIYVLDGRYFIKTTAPNGFYSGNIPGNPSHLDYWGTGWSLVANIGNHLDARLTMAFPLINEDQLPNWSPLHDLRLYFAVGAQF